MKKIHIIFLLLLPIVLNCTTNLQSKKTKVTLGIANYSYQIKKVDMQVYINDKKLLDRVIVHDPYEVILQLNYPSGKYKLKVIALQGSVSTEQHFTVSKSDTLIGLTAGFDYHKPDEYDNKYRKKQIATRIVRNGKVIKDW